MDKQLLDIKNETTSHDCGIISNYLACDNQFLIRAPKTIAKVTLCGAITFTFDDTMNFVIPTEEQRENLKKTFGIEVELFD